MFRALILLLLIQLHVCAANAAQHINKSYGYAIFSELKYKEDFQHFDYVNPNAPKGGRIKYAQIGGFDSVNPHILKGNKVYGLEFTYDTLLVASLDELNSYYGLLASSLEYPDDLSWVVFNLREEAYWHDKSPITAEDIVFSVDVLKNGGNPNYKMLLADVKKVEILDNHKVKFIFSKNNDPQLIAVIGQLPVVSKKFFADKDFDSYDKPDMLLSGAYKIKSFQSNKHVVYERVKDYWAKDLPVHRGYYNFDEIEYQNFMESSVAIEALKAGQIDFREENISKFWAQGYDCKAVREGRLIKEAVPHKMPPNLQAIFLNMRKDVLKDRALRIALAYAYDFDWANQNLLYSLYKRRISYFEGTDFQAKGIPSEAELKILNKYRDILDEDVFTKEFVTPNTSGSLMKNRMNIRLAKQTLLEAGYYYKSGKLISPHTKKPVELTIIYHFAGFERSFLAYKENLAKLGIVLKLKLIDSSQYFQRLKEFDFELVVGAFTVSSLPGHAEKQIWHSQSDVFGGFNLSGVRNKAVDEIISDMIKISDKELLKDHAAALDRILLWGYYAIPQLYSNTFKIAYSKRIGMHNIRPAYAIGNETWWDKNAE